MNLFGIPIPVIAFVLVLLCEFIRIYVVFPIGQKRIPLMELDCHYVTFDPRTLGPEVVGFFHSHVVAFTTLNYEVIEYLTKPKANRNTTSVVIYLVDRARGDRCTLACFYIETSSGTMILGRNIILTTMFSEGGGYTTSNYALVNVFKPRPNWDGAALPEVRDPAQLIDIHRVLVSRSGKQPVIPQPGREIQELEDNERASLDYQVTRGLATFDPSTRTYWRTWYGAFYMTWQHLPPFKQINLAKKRARAKKAMREYTEAKRGNDVQKGESSSIV